MIMVNATILSGFFRKREEAKKLDVAAYCFEIIKKIFAGLYITSNVVETVFNVKSKLYPHRTMKSGESVEYKKQIQELFWKYRKEGLDPKEAWEKAKRVLS